MNMSVRLRRRVGKGKDMEKKEEEDGHPVRDACQALNFDLRMLYLQNFKNFAIGHFYSNKTYVCRQVRK